MENFYVLLIVAGSLCKISNTFPRLINNELQSLDSSDKLGLLTETAGNNSSGKAPELDNIRDKIPVAAPVSDVLQISSVLDSISSTDNSESNSPKQKRCPSSNVVGSVRKNPLLLSRRDAEADRERCEKCRNGHLCAVLRKCTLCNNLCEQFNDLPINEDNNNKPTEPDNEAPIIGSPVMLESKFGGEEDIENAGRFYTVAAFSPGTRMNMLSRLLNLKRDNIDKLVVLAKIKDMKENTVAVQDPIIFDISNAFNNDNKTILYKLKAIVENEELKMQLNQQLSEYLKAQDKDLNSLKTDEIDKLINKILELVNQENVGNKRMPIVGEQHNVTHLRDGMTMCSGDEAAGNLPMDKIEPLKDKTIEGKETLPKPKPDPKKPPQISETLREAADFHKLKNLIHQSSRANDIDFDKNGILGQENSPETLNIPVSKPTLQSDNQSLDGLKVVKENNKIDESIPEMVNKTTTDPAGGGGFQQIQDAMNTANNWVGKVNENQQFLGMDKPVIDGTKSIIEIPKSVVKSQESGVGVANPNIVGNVKEMPDGIGTTLPKKILKISKLIPAQPVLAKPQPAQASAAHQEKRLNIIKMPNNLDSMIKSMPKMPVEPSRIGDNPTIGDSTPKFHTSNLPNEFPYNLAVDFQENPKLANPIPGETTIPNLETKNLIGATPNVQTGFVGNKMASNPSNIIVQPKELFEESENSQEIKRNLKTSNQDISTDGQFVQSQVENNSKIPNSIGDKIMNLLNPRIGSSALFDETRTSLQKISNNGEGKIYKVGELVPADDGKSLTSKAFFVGNGIKLPLQILQKEDGSVQLTVDVDRMCDCPNKTCSKLHQAGVIRPGNVVGSQFPEQIVGATFREKNKTEKTDITDNKLPKNSEGIKLEFPNNLVVEKRETEDNLSSKNQFNTLKLVDTVAQQNENAEIWKRSPKFDETHMETTNDNNLQESETQNEEFDDEVTKIRDYYQFQQLEDELENKLDKLNKNIEKFRDENDNIINKSAKTLFKSSEKDENVKRRVDIANTFLGWMKNLIVNH